MIRMTVVALLALVCLGCENEPRDAPNESSAVGVTPLGTVAIEYRGVSYDLVAVGECGPRPDGSYSTWAVTLDSNSQPLPKGPQIHALSKQDWSVIDFYSPDEGRVVRIYRQGEEKLVFEGGVLEFEGELGAGDDEKAQARITCTM